MGSNISIILRLIENKSTLIVYVSILYNFLVFLKHIICTIYIVSYILSYVTYNSEKNRKYLKIETEKK